MERRPFSNVFAVVAVVAVVVDLLQVSYIMLLFKRPLVKCCCCCCCCCSWFALWKRWNWSRNVTISRTILRLGNWMTHQSAPLATRKCSNYSAAKLKSDRQFDHISFISFISTERETSISSPIHFLFGRFSYLVQLWSIRRSKICPILPIFAFKIAKSNHRNWS